MSKDGKGLRHNKGKNPLHLVPPSLVFAVGEVLEKGASKYAERNWEKGMSWCTVYGCLMRHIMKWASPFHSDKDEETGLNHLYHAAANIAMLIEYQFSHPSLDDRPKHVDEDLDSMMDDMYDEHTKDQVNEILSNAEKKCFFV